MAEVREQKYAGVSVDHPRIIEVCKQMEKDGRTVGEIVAITGQPAEVVRRHAPKARTDR